MDLGALKDAVKETLKSALGSYYEPVRNYVFDPPYSIISGLWTSSENTFALYLITSILIAYGVYRTTIANHDASTRGFFRYLVPRDIYLHPSALVDYKYYFVNAYVSKLLFAAAVFTSAAWAAPVTSLLQHLFGVGPQWQPTAFSRVVYTFLAFLAFDLSGYVCHYMQHRVPLLWQFHKTHHSAEVLTPITTFRNHPVDELLEGFVIAMVGGTLIGIFKFLYVSSVSEYMIINVSIIMICYLVFANLLHSHIWLSFGWKLNHIFNAPCMHQIHHSSERRHFDCNFGRALLVWDFLFKTLYVPKEREVLKLGISNDEHLPFNSVWHCYSVPFEKAFALLRSRPTATHGGNRTQS